MEKRRLLLVVMLLATSGVVLAAGSDAEGEDSPRKGRAGRARSYVFKKTRTGWQAAAHFVTWPARKLAKAPVADDLRATVGEAEEEAEVTISKASLDAFMERYERFVRRVHFGITAGLAVALVYTARNKKVQEGVKGLVRRVRSIRLRKKTPEKKTDASAISA